MEQNYQIENRFRLFYFALFFTTILPYIPFLIRIIPGQFFGFNLTGWAWMIMLFISVILLYDTKNIVFPVYFWLPWILFLSVYIVTDYTFIGFQLTLQYILPILIGIIASGFIYTEEKLSWIFRWFKILCVSIYILYIIGLLFRRGNTPVPSATPMLFSVLVSLLVSFYFITKESKYLFYCGILLIVSVLGVRRMGIAATTSIFIFHFANQNLRTKIIYGILGSLLLFFVFNSKRFQEETFYGGKGQISDLTFNYYENPKLRSSGRQSWKKALQPGLEKEPVWGNGPRADNVPLTQITGREYAEAHNDYLSVRYNYGYAGLGVLLSCFVMNFISLYRIFRKHSGNFWLWTLSSTVLTLFISFLMFMYTDNILKYTIFFPNYFFALIGIVYSLKRNEDIGSYPIV